MYNVKILDVLSGWFLKDGNRFETHFVLTETTSDRGVRFELQRCTKAFIQTAVDVIGDNVNDLCYDKYGRVMGISLSNS